MEQAALTGWGRREWRWFCLITGGAAFAAALAVFAGDVSQMLLWFAMTAGDVGVDHDELGHVTTWSRGHSLGAFAISVVLGLVVLRLRESESWGGRDDRTALLIAMVLAAIAAGMALFLEWQLQTTLDLMRRLGTGAVNAPPDTMLPHIIQWLAAAASVATLAWVAARRLPPRDALAGKAMSVALIAAGLCGLCFLAAGNVAHRLETDWEKTGGQPQPGDMLETIWGFGFLDVSGWLLWVATFAAVLIAGTTRSHAPSEAPAFTEASPPSPTPTPPSHHTASPPLSAQPADRVSE